MKFLSLPPLSQWFSLVESTRTKKPFQVARIKREDFKSLKTFSKKFVNRKNTADKEQLSFHKIPWFCFSKSEPTKVLVRHTLQEEGLEYWSKRSEIHIISSYWKSSIELTIQLITKNWKI